MSLFTKLGNEIASPVDAAGNLRPVSNADMQRWLTEAERLFMAVIAGQGGDIDLPNLMIRYTVTGGTADAIVATPNLPLPDAPGLALFSIQIEQANTGNVTINGKRLLTNTGSEIAAGGVVANGIYLFLDDGAGYRLLSDQASIAIQAAAEYAALQASEYADFARNNWVAIGPFVGTGVEADYPLSIDPGSANNMFVVVGGVTQLISQNAYSLAYTSGDPFLRINVPNGVPFEVRVSNAIDVNTPSDGSVSTPKIADKAVTYTKMQDVSETLRLLGRATAGAGPMEEITASQLRSLFLPTGSVIQSAYAEYVSNADITAVIPADDTIPQITEGTEILSVSITPTSATSKLRLSFTGVASLAAAGPAVWAIFVQGTSNAIAAGYATVSGSSYVISLSGSVEVVAGTTSSLVFKVRVGPGTAGTMRLNGTAGSRVFGGASRAVLTVEEVKA